MTIRELIVTLIEMDLDKTVKLSDWNEGWAADHVLAKEYVIEGDDDVVLGEY